MNKRICIVTTSDGATYRVALLTHDSNGDKLTFSEICELAIRRLNMNEKQIEAIALGDWILA